MVSISACHAEDPGSIPGRRATFCATSTIQTLSARVLHRGGTLRVCRAGGALRSPDQCVHVCLLRNFIFWQPLIVNYDGGGRRWLSCPNGTRGSKQYLFMFVLAIHRLGHKIHVFACTLGRHQELPTLWGPECANFALLHVSQPEMEMSPHIDDNAPSSPLARYFIFLQRLAHL